VSALAPKIEKGATFTFVDLTTRVGAANNCVIVNVAPMMHVVYVYVAPIQNQLVFVYGSNPFGPSIITL